MLTVASTHAGHDVGPGDYHNDNYSSAGPAYSLGPRPESTLKNDVPGPGHYEYTKPFPHPVGELTAPTIQNKEIRFNEQLLASFNAVNLGKPGRGSSAAGAAVAGTSMPEGGGNGKRRVTFVGVRDSGTR